MILDFNNIFHLAHVPWTYETPSPNNNGVIANFIGVVAKQVEDLKADVLLIAIEGSPKHRKDVDGVDYKGNRHKPDDDKWTHFKRQMRLLQSSITKMFSCMLLRHENLESDDTIYETILSLIPLLNESDEIIICSSDKDLIQCLIDDRIKLWSPQQKCFREKPEYDFLAYKALQGDSSDNISGIDGIGPKRAEKILHEGLDVYFSKNPQNKEIFDRNIKIMKLHRWSETVGERTISPSLCEFSESRFKSILNGMGIYQNVDLNSKRLSKLKLPANIVSELAVKAIE